MPIFRELWGWTLFAVLAIICFILKWMEVSKESQAIWETALLVGKEVSPLWVTVAIFSYTVTEGYSMLAEAFTKKSREAGKIEGKVEERAAILETIAANPGMTLDDIRRMIEERNRPEGAAKKSQ